MNFQATIPPSAFEGLSPSFLGPARVIEVKHGKVYLECADAYAWAYVATAFFYFPKPGDIVLAISNERDWYVIGVFASVGPTQLCFPDGLEITAPAGPIRFATSKEIELKAKKMRFLGQEIQFYASWFWQRCKEFVQKVAGCCRMESGRVEQNVAGELHQEAGSIFQRGATSIKLRSQSIDLN
ncbi:MAG: hypothetical protein N2035_00160 [Chthoniobacterales bacterium]|nr:hypothetical protein [Chthoniobacterales bacterium]